MSDQIVGHSFYILCAPNFATGGTELAHQAANNLCEMGYNAKMLYMHTADHPVNERFECYNVPWTFQLDDRADVTIILPETSLGYIQTIKHAKVIAWWMSVDNYLTYASISDLVKNKRLGRMSASFKRTVREKVGLRAVDVYANRRISLKSVSRKFHLHLYQSEYAKQFLHSYGIFNVSRLSDYINDYYVDLDVEEHSVREDIVLYNPNKGLDITSRVMAEVDEVEWVPLKGLSVSEMRSLLLRAKVYVDFGNHPGKDRIPREAAASGCVVITNKKGSAAYFEDIPIDDEFKVPNGSGFLELAASAIRRNLVSYETQLKKQDSYRDMIFSEKRVFCEELQAVAHGLGRC